MQDAEIIRTTKRALAAFRDAGFQSFVREDNLGARHSLDLPDERQSAINTAALLRLQGGHHDYLADVDTRRWSDDVIQPELAQLTERVEEDNQSDDANRRRCEFEAYRLAKLLQAVPDERAAATLETWLSRYLEGWARRDYLQASIYLISLAVAALPSTEHLRGRITRVAESVVTTQLAAIDGRAGGSIDYLDLGLALAVAGQSLPPLLRRRALGELNEAASESALWVNHTSTMFLGNRAVVCSSFEVCVALLAGTRATNYGALKGAFVCHLEWLTENAESGPFCVSDAHARVNARETWFSCLAVDFLERLQDAAEANTQGELRGKFRSRMIEGGVKWQSLALPEATRKSLEKMVIEPAQNMGRGKLDCCTVLLFGPPGTAKTTVAESAARELGWPFIALGVADLLKEGLERVYATSLQLFEDLTNLRQCVVLLDEMEALFADRTEAAELTQQFLTAALLPPLKQLHDSGRIILFVATNYVERFDSAIRRPGRIDLILPIGPPDVEQRAQLLSSIGMAEHTAVQVAKQLREGTTIAELLMFKRLMAADGNQTAEQLLARWEASVRSAWQIPDKQLLDFESQTAEYARHD